MEDYSELIEQMKAESKRLEAEENRMRKKLEKLVKIDLWLRIITITSISLILFSWGVSSVIKANSGL